MLDRDVSSRSPPTATGATTCSLIGKPTHIVADRRSLDYDVVTQFGQRRLNKVEDGGAIARDLSGAPVPP